MVYQKTEGCANLVDLSVYRQQKLDQLARTAIQNSAWSGETERISLEESQLRRAIRLHAPNPVQKLLKPWSRVAYTTLASASITILLLFLPSAAEPALIPLFAAVAMLIPLIYEYEYLYAFLAYTLPLAVASIFVPAPLTMTCYVCFGVYTLVRNMVAVHFTGRVGVASKIGACVLPSAMLWAANSYMGWALWWDELAFAADRGLYGLAIAIVILAIFGGLELFIGLVWRAYAALVHAHYIKSLRRKRLYE